MEALKPMHYVIIKCDIRIWEREGNLENMTHETTKNENY